MGHSARYKMYFRAYAAISRIQVYSYRILPDKCCEKKYGLKVCAHSVPLFYIWVSISANMHWVSWNYAKYFVSLLLWQGINSHSSILAYFYTIELFIYLVSHLRFDAFEKTWRGLGTLGGHVWKPVEYQSTEKNSFPVALTKTVQN